MQVELFNPITLTLPRDKIYSRLGYAKGITKLEARQKNEVDNYIGEALGFIELAGAGARIPIREIGHSQVMLEENISFESRSLAELLSNCQEILLMAATAGSRIVGAISRDSRGKDITAAVVFDAAASEMTDAALSWIMNYFNRQISRENKQLSRRRFSAGYGDFSLENQKVIYDVLDLSRLGVSLSEERILIPEKTVTAVAGIRLKG